MRVRNETDGLSVHAIAGTHVVIIGLDVKPEPGSADRLTGLLSGLKLSDTNGRGNGVGSTTRTTRSSSSSKTVKGASSVFLGFAIDRTDMTSMKTVSLNGGRPIQKFHFGDYTAEPGKQYQYTVRRMTKASSSDHLDSKFVPFASAVTVKIMTEDPNKGRHGIYFNRGVAGSKAFLDKFGEYRKYHLVNKFGSTQWRPIINPRSIPDLDKSKEALSWLSRGLEEALLQFISQASGDGNRLLATVYEFTHPETIQAFADAVVRGVDVKIIRHCKGSYHPRVKREDIVKDKQGKIAKDWIPDEPTGSAKKAIDTIGFKSLEDAHKWQHDTFIERKHSSGIMHNKFIVLVKDGKPVQVWTGSVNPTDGGIYGQSNVGHIVRDADVASQYQKYWETLSRDLPGRKHPGKGGAEDGPMDDMNERQQPDLDGPILSPSTKVIFSPRSNLDMLQWYADRMASAKSSVHFTAAFGVAQPIAQVFNQGQQSGKPEAQLRRSPRIARRGKAQTDALLRYILLDNKPSERSSEKRRDGAAKKGGEYVDYYDFKDGANNRIAFGAILSGKQGGEGGQGDEGKHENECLTGLTTFVDYIHLKVCLVDALTDNPLVITGSANFSAASTEKASYNSWLVRFCFSLSVARHLTYPANYYLSDAE